MATRSEGSTANIVACEEGTWVEKRYKRGKRGAMEHERRIHGGIQYCLEQEALRVPLLHCEPTRYIMERVDVSKPLWEAEVSDQHIEVLATGLLCLWRNGYELRDVEVYLQPDGSLCMLDFGQVTQSREPSTKLLSAAIVPPYQVERLENTQNRYRTS
jgi:hypothetical protein